MANKCDICKYNNHKNECHYPFDTFEIDCWLIKNSNQDENNIPSNPETDCPGFEAIEEKQR